MCFQMQPLQVYVVDGSHAQCSCVHRRKGLKAALAGREDKSLSAILRFLIRYIGDYRFTRTLIDVANMLLGKEMEERAGVEVRN